MRRWGLGGAVVLTFVAAVRLMKTAGDLLRPELADGLFPMIETGWQALGAGWLGSYLAMNGSLVAALALTLLTGLLVPAQLFLVLAGTRLGGAAVVILVGVGDYVHRRRQSLARSCGLGSLAFLVTHLVYVPASVLGFLFTSASWFPLFGGDAGPLAAIADPTAGGLAPRVSEVIGPGPSFALGLAVLLLSLHLFDRLLETVDMVRVRSRYLSRLQDRWISFVAGLLITAFTTSVAFSVAVLVPIYNRGHIRREEILPYLLGANLSTLTDTMLVAVLSGPTVAVEVTATLALAALLCTLPAVLFVRTVGDLLGGVHDRILGDLRWFAAFVASLLLVPAAFLLIG